MEQSSARLVRTAKGALLGLCVALAAAVLLTFFFSALLTLGVPEGIVPFFAHLTVLLAAAGGGMAAGIKGKTNGLLSGLFTAAALFLLHFLGAVLFGEISLSFLTYLGAEVLGGILGGILGVNLRRD